MNSPYRYIVNPAVITGGTYDSITKLWSCMLPQQIYNRRLNGLTIQGPISSKASIYLGVVNPANLIDTTQRGNSNTADYSGGPYIIQQNNFVVVQWTPLGSNIFTGLETVTCTFRVEQVD